MPVPHRPRGTISRPGSQHHEFCARPSARRGRRARRGRGGVRHRGAGARHARAGRGRRWLPDGVGDGQRDAAGRRPARSRSRSTTAPTPPGLAEQRHRGVQEPELQDAEAGARTRRSSRASRSCGTARRRSARPSCSRRTSWPRPSRSTTPKRKGDVVDVVIGSEFQQLATTTEVTSRWSSWRAGAAAGRLRRRPPPRRRPHDGRTSPADVSRAAGRVRARPAASCSGPKSAGGAATTISGPAGAPRARSTRSPASAATSPPAAWSHGVQPLLEVRVQRALGRQAQVQRGRAEPPDVADPGDQRRPAPRPGAPAAPRRSRTRWRPAPGRASVRAEPVQPPAVAPRAAAARRGPLLAGGGVAHHAGHHDAVHLGGQRDRVLRQAVEVVHGAVDRVEDPPHRARRRPPARRRTPRPARRRRAARAAAPRPPGVRRPCPRPSPRRCRCSWSATSVIASARIRRAVAAASRAIRTAIASSSPGRRCPDVRSSRVRPFRRYHSPGSASRPGRPTPGGVRATREDLAGRRYNSPLPTASRTLSRRIRPRPGGSHTTPASLVPPRAALGSWPCSLIASGRSFVTEAHQTVPTFAPSPRP